MLTIVRNAGSTAMGESRQMGTGRINEIASTLLACALTFSAAPALADRVVTGGTDDSAVSGGGSAGLPPYLQCVPYARQVTGIQIRGDAWTWWDQAAGRYGRGTRPKVGAVMAFEPHGHSRLGHVAAVSRIVDSRTVLIRHANWSPINGRRGQIEDNVRAVDVSPANDWSEVRVWFAPSQALGTTHWPIRGFIYPAKGKDALRNDAAGPLPRQMEPRRARPDNAGSDPIGSIIAARLAARD